ncbi:MAG: peptidoglycan-associated lipoprotein Pal [Candidatus Electrothrix scaldis]|nr:MAG: peptidoglycan-associated lipoprotein Pal [Candidatus Electrothrix sp. GW3-3]
MNTFMPRMLLLACMTLPLILSGCGPKEIEPYQATTEESSKPELATATTYPLSYGNLQEEEQGAIEPGAIEEENMGTLVEDLPLPEEEEGDNTPIVETLDAGSGPGEQKLGFGSQAVENKSTAYKKEHGRSSVQLRPVYFNFDQSEIRKDQIVFMEHNADYLKSNVASNVLIEGNCDEQGTNEYNLALGERRAMTAKKYLIKLGVDSARIRTVSYGEERPLFTGSEENDYSYNRRDDFVLE